MSFQSTVNRNYTAGWPGEVISDGPQRGRPGRISSLTIDSNGNTNRIGRAFGWTADVAATGATNSAVEITAGVGAIPFAGILANPKHYVLQGTAAGGTLAPSYDLPQYYEGEFMDMGIILAELFNETTSTKAVAFGDGVCYVTTATTALQNPNGLPLGALVSYTQGSVPAGFTAIPNARVTNDISIAASGVGAVASGYTKIQLTQ